MIVWIYNDVSCAQLMGKGSKLFGEKLPKITVEVSNSPGFEHYFGFQSPEGFPGICGLLDPEIGIEDLAVSVGDNYAPMIFSPHSAVSPSLLGSALGLAFRNPDISDETVAFIDIGIAKELLPWLSAAQQVGLLLDVSSAPEKELVESIQRLVESELISPDKWIGLRAYDSRDDSFGSGDSGLVKRLGLERVENASSFI